MKYYPYLGAFFLLILPHLALAQTSLQNVLNGLLTFIDGVLIPFLFGIAFLFFVFNIVRYLVIGGGNEEARDNAKNLALYGLGAFVFLIIFWGIVNLVVDSIGLQSGQPVQSDYVTRARQPGTTNPTPAPDPSTSEGDEEDGEDLDLSIDDPVESIDSPAGCIQFSVDGICLDPMPPNTQYDTILDMFRGATIGREVNGESWELGTITHTPNSTSFILTNTTRGASFRITQTNIGPEGDDIMVRLEELRNPNDPSTLPPRSTTVSLTFNQNSNQYDVFIVTSSTSYTGTHNGVAYVNSQGQMVMKLIDSYGRESTTLTNTYLTDFIQGRPLPPVQD